MRDAALALVTSGTTAETVRILCVSRPEPPFEMAIPGGTVEAGEAPALAATRELAEETGVVGVASRCVWIGESPSDGRRVLVYRVSATSGAAGPQEPGARVGWFSPGELVGQGAIFGEFTRRMLEGVRL